MKAITLMSGGLDSTLATRIIKDLGIELTALNTVSPFCLCNHRSASGNSCGIVAQAEELNIKLITLNVSDEFLEIVKHPKHGYGSNMNPCIDCRILLFKKAKELMPQEQASFVITGEVLGQRPMSQRLDTMRLIEKEAGLTGLVLRPLSAKVLEPSLPELRGWVEREKLLAISGRGRREQFALANEFGINDYPCPAGGCLLTDPEFSRRLKDLMAHQEINLGDIRLLKVGRHFRLSQDTKLIVGRDEKENGILNSLAKDGDYVFAPHAQLAGPTSLGRGVFNEQLIRLSCMITGRYCDIKDSQDAEIVYSSIARQKENSLRVAPIKEADLKLLRV